MREAGLPVPRYAITDVGTRIFEVRGGSWRRLEDWEDLHVSDWRDRTWEDLAPLIDIPGVRLQERNRQGERKLSFTIAEGMAPDDVLPLVERSLSPLAIRLALIWSVDASTGEGLLDVIPASATKRHAVDFLRDRLGIPASRTMYAGDSGNDLSVFELPIASVLVSNAREDVKQAARAIERADATHRLHISSLPHVAGVLEGIERFFPDVAVQLQTSREFSPATV